MAVVQYTAAVNQIRGKLNGSVFNKYKTGYSLQRKQQPPKGWRGNQLQIRSRYSLIQRYWKQLTDGQRNSWATTAVNNPATNRFGEQVTLSGYNQFLKANLLNQSGVGAMVLSGYAAPAPTNLAGGYEVADISVSVNDNGETIMSGHVLFSVGAFGPDWRYMLDVSLPQSQGVTVYHRGWRSLVVAELPLTVDTDFSANLGSSYPSIRPGARLWYRLRLLHRLSGAVTWVEALRIDVPDYSALATWSLAYAGIGNPSTFSISYSPASVGWPDFMHIVVRATGGHEAPPTQQDLVLRLPEVEEGLRLSNTYDTFITIPPGQYVGYQVQLVWSSTGEIVGTSFFTQQG